VKKNRKLKVNPTTMTETEFCATVGISRVTAWKLRAQGKLSHCKVGTRILYLQRHVDEFLAQQEIRAQK
jgi:Helix-turn-helix domain